ncbi:MAG: hypothetical protein Q9174_002822 [Haloplaca sp. 1 TL-2023]
MSNPSQSLRHSTDVRVLVSTSSQVSWIVLEGVGCRANDDVCANARGGLFDMNASSTWQSNGFWQLGNERNLDIFANGLFGNDTLGLGIPGSGGPTLENQIMAMIGTEDFYLGMFAINPKRTNYTGITEQGQASYMTTLREQGLIPSVSFGYTAGAQYRLKKVLGSLTLGGYDQSRFTPNNMSFSFAPDTDRDLVVGIQSIVSTEGDGTPRNLLPTPINAYVDSTVPQIWLPVDACKAFEQAFDLKYDSENKLYPVSEALHTKLLARKPSIRFTLGNTDSGGQTIDITLPYASFDLQAKPPFTANATRYFPLQRAANDTQYTLGRTFLQEAYLTVDWERGNFSLSQCLFDPDKTEEELITIRSVNATTVEDEDISNKSTIIATGVGIAVGIVLLASAIGTFIVVRRRRQRRQTATSPAEDHDDEAEKIRQGFAKAELDTDLSHTRFEIGSSGNSSGPTSVNEWVDEKGRHPGLHAELVGDGSRVELTGGEPTASELATHKVFSGPYHEMYDPSVPPAELPADLPPELAGSPPPTFSRSFRSASQAFKSAPLSSVSRSNGSSPFQPGSQGPVGRRQPRLKGSTVSRSESSQSHSPPPLSSGQASRGPSTPDWSGDASSREHNHFSPISPIGGSEDSTDGRALFSLVRGISEPRQPQRARKAGAGRR